LKRESWRLGDPREADQENSLYLFVINDEHENRPQESCTGYPYGDDPEDQKWIQKGIEYYNCRRRNRK
jgi:hypothetical protein